jgi:hypothetical protein
MDKLHQNLSSQLAELNRSVFAGLEELLQGASEERSDLALGLEQLEAAIGMVETGLEKTRSNITGEVQQMVEDVGRHMANALQALSLNLTSDHSALQDDVTIRMNEVQDQDEARGDILLGRINLNHEKTKEAINALNASTLTQGEFIQGRIRETNGQNADSHNQLKTLIYVAIALSGMAIGLCAVSLAQHRSRSE